MSSEAGDEGETERCCDSSPWGVMLCFPEITRTAYIVACANVAAQMNYNSIIIAMIMLDKTSGEVAPTWATSLASSVSFLGSIVGQVCLGFAGDAIGRLHAMAVSLALMAAGALSSALAWELDLESRPMLYLTISLGRFLAGLGVGGTYPLSATAAFEAVQSSRSAALVRSAWALFWQVPGAVVVYVLAAVVAAVPSLSWTTKARIVLASGAVPAAAALPAAMSLAAREGPAPNKQARTGLRALTEAGRLRLLGASAAWFLFDVYSYGVGVYSADIAEWIYGGSLSVERDAWYNAACAAVGLPSCVASIWLLAAWGGDVGRLQARGFAAASATFCALAAVWLAKAPTVALATIFVITRSAIIFGVAVSTFVAPVVLFPTRVRATANGIAAAAGKLGGLLGTYGLVYVADAVSPPALFWILAAVAAAGVAVTLAFLDVLYGPADRAPALDALSLRDDSKDGNGELSRLWDPASKLLANL